ncbi:hypothetical protein FQR65_LT07783 [Abscondita terminalis]|nr:hypothetical protein FQR65_LT07783 [Abscondita terminalis]
MIKVYAVIVFLGSAWTQSVIAEKNLCYFQKTKSTCLCRLITRPVYDFPVLSADCSSLNLIKFPRDENVPNVEELDLSFNAITNLDSYTNNFESFCLLSVKLSYNRITAISQDYFKNIPNLKELDLSHNDIPSFVNSNIFRGLTNLTILNLSFNSLSTVPADIFKPLVKLKELDLRYNYLGAALMNADDFFKTTLGVSRSIEILKIDGLGITQLNYTYFARASKLTYLSVSDNPLKEIPKLPYAINYLDVSGTHLTTISAKYLDYHSLKVLKLNKLKKLERIEHYAFYNLMALEELHLSESKGLNELNDLVFGAITNDTKWNLKKMYLSSCGIKKLNATFLNLFKTLEHLDLQNNPWDCSCDMMWLQKLNGSLYKGHNLRCSSPFSLRNQAIMRLSSMNIPECFNTSNFQRIIISILGILIGILIMLIIYLVYMGPFHQKTRGVGPNSPYGGYTVGINPTRAENLLN